MLTPAVLFALFLVFLGLTWTLSLAESAFSYLSRRDAEDIVRERPGSKVLEIARERESHLGALRVWRFVADRASATKRQTRRAPRWLSRSRAISRTLEPGCSRTMSSASRRER